MASIVGIVIPMEPAVELTGSSGRREVGVSRVHRGNRHTKMSACAGASSHSRHRRVEALIFGDIMGDVQGYGWCGCGEDHGPLGPQRVELGCCCCWCCCLVCVRGGRWVVFLVFLVLVLPLAAPEKGEAGSDRTR